MALQKSKVSIPLSEGVNTKIDPNQKPIGTLENLENAVFDEPGRIKKRTGYSKLDTLLIDDSEITDTQRITSFMDELCMFNNTNFYSYSEATNRWTNKGTVSNIFPTSESIIRNTYEQSNFDSIHVSRVNAYIWEDTRGGIRASVVDDSTGNFILSDTEITSSGIKPRVESIGNNIYFIYIDGTDLKYRSLTVTKPTTINPEVVVVSSDINGTNKTYDTTSIDKSIFFVWNSSTNTLKIRSLNESNTLGAVQEESGENPTTTICASSDQNNRLLISYYDGSDVKAIIRSFNLLANIVAPTSLETISDITNVSIGSSDGQNYTVLYEQSSTDSFDHRIRKNTIDLSATTGTASDYIRSCGLASKQFKHSDRWYVAAIHKSSLQSTIFIINQNSEVVTKISQGLAGDLLDAGHLPKISSISESTYLLITQKKGRTITEDNVLFSLLGLTSTSLDFDSDVKFDSASLGQQLHTNGGMIQSYDGKEVVEHSFHIYPENLADGGTATTGGSISDGTYQYSAVYTWTDNKGQLHRSAPSPALEISLSGGTSTQTQTVTIPTLRITEKSNVVIELYRTEAAGTLFYKVSSTTSPQYNDKTVDSVDITDDTSDTDLIDNELLYTTGGVLDNIAPPAASIIETFQNRIFLAGLEDENQIQFSKIRQEASPVEFNDSQVINVNSRGGKIVALAAMDDKLIIFKERAIFYLSGEGPNNLGEQNNFIEPELITNDVGCSTQNSVVLTPDGLMFQSEKGIYLLTKNIQTVYIGAAVEDFNNLTIRSANLVTNKNIVIFLTDDKSLVYNYFVQKWTTYTNHIGISATSLNGIYYYVRQNNEVYRESNTYTDNGSFIKLRLESSWLSFAGVQGYQRVYRMLVLGEYKNPHKLLVKVAYNFLDTYTQEKLVDTSDFTSDTVYGGDSPYGTGTPYGGTGNRYQARINMKTQKCESIKILIEDSQDSDYSEALQLSNILFVVGVKKGEYKLPQANTYGTN